MSSATRARRFSSTSGKKRDSDLPDLALISTSSPARKARQRKPSHLGSNCQPASFGSSVTSLASIGARSSGIPSVCQSALPLPGCNLHRFACNKLADRRLKRTLGIAIVHPGFALCEKRGHGLDREAHRIEAVAHLVPVHRHRDGRARPCSRRQRRDGGRHAVIAEIVEEDAARALLLRHVDQILIGTVVGHVRADAPGRRPWLPSIPIRCPSLTFSGVTTCSPLPPVVLQNEMSPSVSRRVAHLLGGCDHGREGNVGSRIQIEHKATGQRGMVRLAIPGVEFHGRDLGHGDQALRRDRSADRACGRPRRWSAPPDWRRPAWRGAGRTSGH